MYSANVGGSKVFVPRKNVLTMRTRKMRITRDLSFNDGNHLEALVGSVTRTDGSTS